MTVGRRPSVIFFDLGNTLVTGTAQSARQLLAARLGLGEKQARRAGKLIMTVDASEISRLGCALQTVLPYHDPVDITKVLADLWIEQYECVREAEGAGSLLLQLKDAGLQLGLISNTWMPFYMGFCSKYPSMADLFDYTVLSFRVGAKKPSETIFTHALRLCGKDASDCLVVGDSYELDISPARGLGFQTAWLLSRPERERFIIARMLRGAVASPDTVAGDLAELTEIFRERLQLWI